MIMNKKKKPKTKQLNRKKRNEKRNETNKYSKYIYTSDFSYFPGFSGPS